MNYTHTHKTLAKLHWDQGRPYPGQVLSGSYRGKGDHRFSREVWCMERKEKARERRVNKVS